MASQSITFRPTAVIRQIPWSLDRRAALGLLLILGTFSLVGWLYLGQASVITSSTLQIEKLQQQIELANQQNVELVIEIAEIESLSSVKERARVMGFAPTRATEIRYIPVSNYPATVSEKEVILAPDSPKTTSAWEIWGDYMAAWVTGKTVQR